MSSPTATKSARSRHVRPSSQREHVPARSAAPRSHGLPSPRRVLAAQVIAWHNAHPLARRISRHQLGGYGVISLPFSPPAEGEGETQQRFPMFDDLSMIKGIPRNKIVALALADGWEERPGAPEWPLREVRVARGWNKSQTRRIHLLTVAIKRGGKQSPLRVLIGRHGLSSQGAGIVGQRLLSRPRMALVALVLSLPLLLVGWGVQSFLWQSWQGWRGSRPVAPLVAEAPRHAPTTATAPAPVMTESHWTAPPPVAALNALPPGARSAPDDILNAPGASAKPNRGPRVGSGVSGGQDTKAGEPSSFRLVGAPQQDAQALRNQAMQLQSALQSMGQTGSRLRMDVIGTPDGDAVSVGPLPDQAEAERIARRLAAHGLTLRVTEQ